MVKRESNKAGRNLVWLPISALIVLVVVLVMLAQLVWKDWRDERQDTLIQDILWLEQTLRQRFQSMEEWSATHGADYARGRMDTGRFQDAARLLLRENPELLAIELRNPDGDVLWFAGRYGDVPEPNPGAGNYQPLELLDTARRLAAPAYSTVHPGNDGQPLVDMMAPVFDNGRFLGVVQLTYQLNQVLYHHVPWWIAQKYQISVVDLGGSLIASKFNVVGRVSVLSHEIEFTPPGHGLRLKATSYRSGLGIALPVLVSVLVLLVLLLIGSLWKIRQYIRQRASAEQALQRETALRASIENSMKNGLIAIDADGCIRRVNRAFCDMLGVEESCLIGQRPPYSFWPQERHAELDDLLDGVRRGEIPPLGFELVFQRTDGVRFDVRLYVTPLRDGAGHQQGWLASFYDITEHRRRRLAVAAAQERLATVLNGLDAPVCVSRCSDRQLLFSNRAFEENMIGSPENPFCVVLPWPPDTDVQSPVLDCQLSFAGSSRVYQIHRRQIEWVDGEAVWLGIYTDMTESVRLAERERLHVEKLQATARLVTMGEMASTLAHELNQPLAAIATYAAACERRLQSAGAVQDIGQIRVPLERIASQARRAGAIIHGIRGFVKKHSPQLSRCDINQIVDSVLTLALPVMRQNHILLHTDLNMHCPQVDMDRVMIEQVLLNLVNNAVEAMRDAAIVAPQLHILTRPTAEGGVEVQVADNGPGIPPERVSELFTPFFTTKAEGMGIGLNICRSIIEHHHGRFDYRPGHQGGSVFGFTLPSTHPAARTVQEQELTV